MIANNSYCYVFTQGSQKKKHEILHTELRIMAQELVFSNFKINAIHEKLHQHVINNW